MFSFSIINQKHPFWTNLVQKLKIVSFTLSLVPRLIPIWRIQWWYSVFLFRLEIPFLGKFGPKTQNCWFKLKFGTYTNYYKQHSMVVFSFFCFRPASFVQKIHLAFWCYLVNVWAVYLAFLFIYKTRFNEAWSNSLSC